MAKNATRRVEESDDTENGATESLTIAGQTFTIPSPPYQVGDEITPELLAVIKQIYQENVRNNMAKKVKAGQAGQAEVTEYASKYRFGVRGGGGGRTTDPVRREAMRLAVDKIEEAIRKQGKKVAEYTRADITARAKELVETRPAFMETARANVQARQDIDADIDLS